MGIGAVFVYRNVGAVLPDEALALHGVLKPRLHGELSGRAALVELAAQPLPGSGKDRVNGALSAVVACDPVRGEHGFKTADEVGRAHDLLAPAPEQLHCARVDHGNIHERVARGVLHRDAIDAGEHGLEIGLELLPRRVRDARAGQRVEPARFDAMDQLLRRAARRDQVVPAPRDVR